MSSPTDSSAEATPRQDAMREQLLSDVSACLGSALVQSHINVGNDLCVRVATDAWATSAAALKTSLGFDYFCFLSAIDWLPSPFGKGEEDPTAEPVERDTEIKQGLAGGETRMQVFARLVNHRTHVGITMKADVPDATPVVPSWVSVFTGANWHEREAHEMFGISFAGHPDLRNMYLPTDFEGHPLRKDFPLLARMVKPWPGIVDVEPLPGGGDEDDAEGSAE
ncbi:MAG: NADH-quinone oxidoreductase subunit C [bacterium]